MLHKIAPALAAGNAVVLKPARTTPLTALALAKCFVDAGLPEGVLSVLTGAGGTWATHWSATPGQQGVLHRIHRHRRPHHRSAGVKKLSLELGASCPVVVLPDADLELAAVRGRRSRATSTRARSASPCSGSSPTRQIAGDFLDALVPKVEAIRTGDPRPRTPPGHADHQQGGRSGSSLDQAAAAPRRPLPHRR